MTTTTPTVPVDNGVNVEALLGARAAMAEAPQAAAFVGRDREALRWEWARDGEIADVGR